MNEAHAQSSAAKAPGNARRPLALLFCALLAWAGPAALAQDGVDSAAPREAGAAKAEEIGETKNDWREDWVRGSLETRMDFQRAGDETDFELDQILRFQIDPPDHQRIRLRGSLWTTEDLDGGEPARSALRGLNDSFGSDVQARLLYLYLEVDNLWGDSTLRLGRQRIREGVAYNRIDGAYFSQRRAKWDWYAFAGARASVYESAREDRAAGAGVVWRPQRKTRVALDYFYGEDHRSGGEEVRGGLFTGFFGRPLVRRVRRQVDSQSLSLTVTQRLGLRHTLFGRYTLHGNDSDELRLSVTGALDWRDIVYDFSYRRRLNILRDRTNDLSGFYRVLGSQDEFEDYMASVHIPLGGRFTLSLEGQARETKNDALNTGNRDFQRYALVLGAQTKESGLAGNVALERWNVGDGEGSWAITGEISKAWEKTKVSFGADYERYEERLSVYNARSNFLFDSITAAAPLLATILRPFFTNRDVDVIELHENIYMLYAKVDHALNDRSQVSARLSFEEDDSSQSPYWRVQAGYTVQF